MATQDSNPEQLLVGRASERNDPAGPIGHQQKIKKKKKKKSKRRFEEEEGLLDVSNVESVRLALWKSYSRCMIEGDPSEIEREDFKSILDSKLIKILPEKVAVHMQIVDSFPSWKKQVSRIQSNGAPLWIILCSSADRCISILKELKDLRRSAKFGKLFSRHMKVHEQVSFLEREAVHVVVGTPARVLKLCELSKLKLSELKVLFLDKQKDQKQRSLLSLR
eukprot:CAMPEP_0197475792 /NCGR_PEP_ID=MMETSP1309-20131121/7200_1 /TAXON_ID=464262 /ORGANISM="Genus nov. species nov., Strain RCC998" /LENGTH=220 /DNA_ID=CAMNT_0043015909 /DNA_START=60 /DNA_END=718 /DNA_ORIENTATION=-